MAWDSKGWFPARTVGKYDALTVDGQRGEGDWFFLSGK
jgi:hypothetical protein